MPIVTREISIDVSKQSVFQTIYAKQNDSNSRFLKVWLMDCDERLVIPSGSTVLIDACREDESAKAFVGTLNEDNSITVPLTNWMLELDGIVKCDITVVDSEERKLSSAIFYLNVEASVYDGSDITEDENYDLLVQLLGDISATKEGLDEITREASSAASLANAKALLADLKATEADEAAKKANDACDTLTTLVEASVEDAENATQRAEVAASHLEQINAECIDATDKANAAATLANDKASLADEKANIAQESANKADEAADNANDKATLADQKAILANQKAVLAEEKANEADEATTRATTAAENAEGATEGANEAKDAANTAAALANEKASNADTATQNANTAATNANTKATLAQEKADLANEKANLAEQMATLAQEKASAADTATQNANTATDAANTAKANADVATENANTAAEAANDAAGRVTDPLQAKNISYDNSDSGLMAEDVKSAIDELTDKVGSVANIAFESWVDVQRIVRLGLAPKAFKIGDQLTMKKGDKELVWDIIGFDQDTPTDSQYEHSMTIQLHDCFMNFQFDAPEALYYCEEELPTGTYYFTIHNYDATYGGNKSYYFTLANAVPAGGQIDFRWGYNVQASTCSIKTYESSVSKTAIETVSVTEGTEGTFLGTTDGKTQNMNHAHRIRYGSNRYSQSAIKQWLNSNAEGNAWWTPTNIYDRPSSNVATVGFLNGMDEDFLAVLGAVNKRTALNTVTDGGGYEDSSELMFLISRSEVYGGKENSVDEGSPYQYYSELSDLSSAGTGTDSNRIKYLNGSARYWWLRSPNSGYGNYVRCVYTTGNVNVSYANYSNGVAPACCII